jgi:hypothetical protein
MTARILLPYLVVVMVLAGTFYALVLYPFQLDDLTKGFFIGASGAAIQWVFGTATSSATARQQQAAQGATGSPTTPA